MRFSASLPNRLIGQQQTELVTLMVTATAGSTREISSMASRYERVSVPAPPYSSGTSMPSRPISPISWKMSTGKVWLRSRSATPGRMRSSAKRRTSPRRSSWSSFNEKSTPAAAISGSASTAMALLLRPC